MIYMIASIFLLPEKFLEFNDIMEKEYLPVVTKHGSKLVASLQTTIGDVDEVTDIWEFENLEKFEKIRQAQFNDPQYMKVRKKFRAMMKAETIKVATPFPCSPMK